MEHRAQFFGLAAKIMRDILVDHARKRLSAKRGGQQLRLSLTAAERFGSKPEVELIRAGIEAGKTAVQLQGDKPEGHFWLGANYGGSLESETISGLATVEDVRKEMEKGLRFGNANAFLRFHLAEACQAVGRTDDARQQLNTILSMTPDPNYLPELKEARTQARQMLDKIK